MTHPSKGRGRAVAAPLALAIALWCAGCSTPHALKVDCDTGLRPINAGPAAAGSAGAAAPGGVEHGA